MTEGNGHIIDPAGDARRALQAVVAEHGPEALSNAVIMDDICQARLSNLPGEAILIGSAARTDVPALLRDLIPRLGNYGAIQSVATTLAEAHGLDTAACVWVVREFARALGLIASGATQPASRVGPGGGTSQGKRLCPDQPGRRLGRLAAVAASPAAAAGGGGADAGGMGGALGCRRAGMPGGPGGLPGCRRAWVRTWGAGGPGAPGRACGGLGFRLGAGGRGRTAAAAAVVRVTGAEP